MRLRGDMGTGRFCIAGWLQRRQDNDPLQDAGEYPRDVLRATSGHCVTPPVAQAYAGEAV